MSVLTVERLNLHYGRRRILRDISFAVGKGEFFIIVGPNGAGKSTLLKAISGIEKDISGRIELFNRGLGHYSRRQLSRTVALVPQSVPLDFPFKVADTVLMGRFPHLNPLGLEGENDYRTAMQAMRFTEVDHLAARRLDQLSAGERQRVIIARTLCQEAGIVLLDEPTAALDPAHQIKIMDLMERLRREKETTVIMISHDLNLAAMYGERVLCMKEGAVISVAPPEEAFSPAQLEDIYGCAFRVDKGPAGGRPFIMPVPEKL